ncbi:hypothetical protein RM697_12075 [Ichthyenterobacterium sp. W332]|uniref:Outer membrane protein beta-barrel domain-containing protein n=1 Tax=Microcosmobacter mediterraneus TaxID=3075607 RepID=A0ABU2YNX2_9FLAO|nr:hypothetical protein [Ichthyenterobacterium sp. W332]MDT0559394.1 hypothetical protein [Ichthyenterobacterium sp. W332]
MKKLTLLLLLVSFLSFGQRDRDSWTFGLGINTINSTGKLSPFNSPDEWAFSNPIALSVEHVWTEYFSIEQSFSFNKFAEGSVIDNALITEDISFFSTNTKVKWYFDEQLFYRNAYWFDLALSGGIGVFNIEDQGLNTSANLGLDFYVWFDDHWGIALKGLTKFAFDRDDKIFLSNHFQYFFEAVYKL